LWSPLTGPALVLGVVLEFLQSRPGLSTESLPPCASWRARERLMRTVKMRECACRTGGGGFHLVDRVPPVQFPVHRGLPPLSVAATTPPAASPLRAARPRRLGRSGPVRGQTGVEITVSVPRRGRHFCFEAQSPELLGEDALDARAAYLGLNEGAYLIHGVTCWSLRGRNWTALGWEERGDWRASWDQRGPR
jgi:hypothetical protein